MPGPYIPDPTPAWLKPENASVTDSALTKAMRMIGHLIGADNPTAQVLGLMMTDVPGGSPTGGLAKAVEGLKARVIKAYHGSPHDFERFSLEKIGTGEGAQAYGHGLYFAENPTVAEEYKRRLSGASGHIPGASTGRGKLMVGDVPPPEGIAGHRALDTAQDIQGLLYYKQAGYPDMAKVSTENIERRIARWKAENPGTGIADADMRELVDYYETHVKHATPDLIKERPPGKMYEVAIHADPEDFLDWDKPLSQQSEKVKQALRSVGVQSRTSEEMEDLKAELLKKLNADPFNTAGVDDRLGVLRSVGPQTKGHEVYHSLAVERPTATAQLKQAGIPGIKYLDQGSRAAGEGSRNYVVFDDRLIDILKKYGLLLPAAGAATEGQTLIQSRDQP